MKKNISPKDGWISLKPGAEVQLDDRLVKDWHSQTRKLRETRGNILAYTIEIELCLDQILNLLFFPKRESNEESSDEIKKLFDVFILKEKPFSSKIQLFKNLCSEHPLLNSAKDFNFKEILSDLDKIRDIRNRFAHNTVTFFPQGDIANQTLAAKLTCYDKDIDLDESYFKLSQVVFQKTMEFLDKLIKYLESI